MCLTADSGAAGECVCVFVWDSSPLRIIILTAVFRADTPEVHVCLSASERPQRQANNYKSPMSRNKSSCSAAGGINPFLPFVSSVFYSFSHTQPMVEGAIKLTEMVHQSESNIRITEIIRHGKDKKKFICIKMLISLFTSWGQLTKRAV